MEIRHINTLSEETLEFLKENLGSSFQNYTEQLSLYSHPYIINFYKNSELIGEFLGERIGTTSEIYELKLVVFKESVSLDQQFWEVFKISCSNHKISAIISYYLDSTISINFPFDEISQKFTCSDVTRIGIDFKTYNEIEKYLGKTEMDYLAFGQQFTIKDGKITKLFQTINTEQIALKEYRSLFESYTGIETQRIIKRIILHYPEYQDSILIRTLNGDFGKLDLETSIALRCEGELAGYILVTINDLNQAFILEVNVHPKYQGLGLGAILLRNACIKCFEQKKCALVKGLIEKSHFMRNFYEKWGSTILKEGKEGIWIL